MFRMYFRSLFASNFVIILSVEFNREMGLNLDGEAAESFFGMSVIKE